MNCEQARERMVDRWVKGIDEAQRIELDQHTTVCPACREEAEALNPLWSAMGSLPVEEPGRNLRLGFYHMMEAYRLGAAQASPRPKPSTVQSISQWVHAWWPKRPALQFAFTAAAMVMGVFGGYLFTTRQHDQERIALMNTEMQNMRHLVTLSLLQQQSASDRLRGVGWSVQVAPADQEVLSALLHTLNTDSNVNVRLAAVDALKQFSSNVSVRRGLREAIPRQSSPLVQIALVDWAVEAMDRGAVRTLEELGKQPDLNRSVQLRVSNAIERLREERKEAMK